MGISHRNDSKVPLVHVLQYTNEKSTPHQKGRTAVLGMERIPTSTFHCHEHPKRCIKTQAMYERPIPKALDPKSPSYARAGTRRNGFSNHRERRPCREVPTSAGTNSGVALAMAETVHLIRTLPENFFGRLILAPNNLKRSASLQEQRQREKVQQHVASACNCSP